MKHTLFVIFALAATLLAACGGGDKAPDEVPVPSQRQPGDKAIYGLACEGCTDSVLVLLPPDCSDPVRYNLLHATQEGRVMGKPKIGDELCVVLDSTKQVASVVNIDELKGIWCYVVMPKLRDHEQMSARMQERMMSDMPDSVKRAYLIPREYGFALKNDWVAQSVGFVNEHTALEEESPVVYPQLGFFTEWHMWNGKLIVVSEEPDFAGTGKKSAPMRDTCNIDYLLGDSLVLSSGGASRSYYRKASMKDVNLKARKAAEEQAKKATETLK